VPLPSLNVCSVTFIEPEIARVGTSEQEAREQGIRYEVISFAMAELDRAIAESDTQGFIKILTKPGSDRIIGVTIIGAQAGELLTEFVLAMRTGLGLGDLGVGGVPGPDDGDVGALQHTSLLGRRRQYASPRGHDGVP
jgi:pyruvate/2-oxoglutarate dehydrogenase complex dihydrolipoamide dehydrogenase (E3) component